MLFGHVAISVLQHHYLKTDLAPTVAGGVFPDVVDKTLCQVLHLTPSGRMFGHTLAGLALSAVVVGLIWGRRAVWSWTLGYLGHLLGDMGRLVPWLYPFVQYDFPPPAPGLLEILRQALSNPAAMGLELALSAWAVCALCWPLVKIRLPTITTAVRITVLKGKKRVDFHRQSVYRWCQAWNEQTEEGRKWH